MDKLRFLRQSSLDRLMANISNNKDRYAGEKSWLTDYFEGPNWYQASDVDAPPLIDLRIPDSKIDHFDFENAKSVYSTLMHLTPLQASDPRVWAYMTHVTCWEYMRKRWPIEQYSDKSHPENIVRERYFFTTDKSRAPLRNGIARLWWCGYSSYDPTRSDPFELTGVLLKKLDVTQNVLENAFGRNKNITKAILEALLSRENQGKEFYGREQVRELTRYIGQIGGVTIIDALPQTDLRNLVNSKIESMTVTSA